MAHLQDLTVQQINQTIEGAVDKQTPVTITVREHNAWASYHSRLLGADGPHLIVVPPVSDHGDVRQLGSADRIGVSFKYGHYKHVFSATVVSNTAYMTDQGQEMAAVRIVAPTRMQRLQRRAFKRVDVNEDALVRAAFWLGGRDVEPENGSDGQTVWTGAVGNISAGGFQMDCNDFNGPQLEIGDVVGVRVMFGIGGETCFADAQCRHIVVDGDRTTFGFQFAGLGHNREGRDALQLISQKVSELQREFVHER